MNTREYTMKHNGKREQERRRRKVAGETHGRLGCDPTLLDHARFAYRWFNDDPARLQSKTKNDDWDMVPQNGEKEDSTDPGKMISVIVGKTPEGQPKRAYLCRKPRQFFEEDQAAVQSALDEQLEQLRRGFDRNGQALSDYTPNSGISL